MALLVLDRLGKSFGEAVVLEDVSLEVLDGEILVLLGPSGSGKTTLLRILAGFEAPNRGRLTLDGEDISGERPAQRNFGMVFQHYALFPHLSVGENVAFGLESRKVPKAEIPGRVARALELVDLGSFEPRRVHQISGGQQQRVALARALAPEPRVLLLDEPLSNLDPGLRERTRRELTDTLRRIGITAVWVTHEQDEAFDVGDRVAVLRGGKLEQVGPAEELYREPLSPFVAGFVGRASTLEGRVESAESVSLRAAGGQSVSWRAETANPVDEGEEVTVVVRPEGLALVPAEAEGALPGRVSRRRFAGAEILLTVKLEGDEAVEVAADAAVDSRVFLAPREGGPAPRIFRKEPE